MSLEPRFNAFPRGGTHLDALTTAAADDPDQALLVLDGRTYTRAEVMAASTAAGRGLVQRGVQPGDRVVLMLPTVPESVWAWFGANLAGAIDAPLAPDTSGMMLDYYLADLEPRVVVATADALARVAAVPTRPELAVVVGAWDGRSVAGPDVMHVAYDDLEATGSDAVDLPVVAANETGTIIYTSGTTGPSKGVMQSRGYWLEMSLNHMRDVPYPDGSKAYCAQPLNHIDARSVLIDCLVSRSTLVLASRFSASGFWADVERYDADIFIYIGTMLHLIYKQPDHQTGRTTRRRIGLGAAAPAAFYDAFEARFDVKLVEGYGMTEMPYMTGQSLASATPGNVGPPVEAVEAQVVDEHGVQVVSGRVGELLVRPRRPHVMMQGYWRKPEATVEAFQDLWFHTGDLMRLRDDGALQYVGRKKDSIRRRGENVSAWEVELVAMRQAGVREAAAFGIPADVGDEDVALLVVALPGPDLDLPKLRAQMALDLPRHALPRFLEIVDALPKTPSERVAKGQVRARGVTEQAYDAEAMAT